MDPYQIQAIIRGTRRSADTIRALVDREPAARTTSMPRPIADWRGRELARNANSLAGLQALAQAGLQSINGRLQQLLPCPPGWRQRDHAQRTWPTCTRKFRPQRPPPKPRASRCSTSNRSRRYSLASPSSETPSVSDRRSANTSRICERTRTVWRRRRTAQHRAVASRAGGSMPHVNLGPDSGHRTGSAPSYDGDGSG